MATRKQIAANRRNALRSTGPQTPEGKAVATRNSLQHGLLARNAVLSDECRQVFLDTLAALDASYQPAGPVEAFLVRQMAAAQWRLDPMNRIETGLLTCRLETVRELESDHEDDEEDEDDDEDHENEDGEENDNDEDDEQDDENQLQESANEPETEQSVDLQEDGDQEQDYDETTRLLGLSFFRDSAGADTFSKLARYETMIRRAYYKALYALVSAQARRLGQPPPGPLKSPKMASFVTPISLRLNGIKVDYETDPIPLRPPAVYSFLWTPHSSLSVVRVTVRQ